MTEGEKDIDPDERGGKLKRKEYERDVGDAGNRDGQASRVG